jgi:O-antigen ligase
VRTKAFFNSKSGQNRLVLWGYTGSYLVSSPQHFFLGAGVRQFFRKIQKPYYDVKKMERLIYPHNIVLNFWSEIGFLGAASFIGLVSGLFLQAKKIKKF